MSRINLVIVITTIVLLNSCMTFDGFNENGTLYENNQSGIYLKLFPDSIFNFVKKKQKDTSNR